MNINQILTPERTFCHAPASSKKRALEIVADFLSSNNPNIDSTELFENLTARERLGSTGIGMGVAIPHCRYNKIEQTQACLVKLKQPVDFDAIDNQPVDILFVLIVPEDAHDEHLQTLAELARLLSQTEYRNQLRKSQTSEELFQAAVHFEKAA